MQWSEPHPGLSLICPAPRETDPLTTGPCKVIDNSEVAQPTKSMESGQQTFYFTGMFLLKLGGHVTKLSKNSNWLIIFVLLSAINVIG